MRDSHKADYPRDTVRRRWFPATIARGRHGQVLEDSRLPAVVHFELFLQRLFTEIQHASLLVRAAMQAMYLIAVPDVKSTLGAQHLTRY